MFECCSPKWIVPQNRLVPQNGFYGGKLFSSTPLDLIQLDLSIFCNTCNLSHQSLSHHHHHYHHGYYLLSTKLKISQPRNDRNRFLVKIILELRFLISSVSLFRLSSLCLCCSLPPVFLLLHLHLIHELLSPLSFLFPSILPSAISSFSGMSFLTLDAFVYIIIPATIVCPQLLCQSLLSLGLCTFSHPPAISIR